MGDLGPTMALKHSLFSRPLIKEKLGQGVTLVVDRYAFSGVAFTSAKEVRAAWPRRGGAVSAWAQGTAGARAPSHHAAGGWASHPFARIRSLLPGRTSTHVAAGCFHGLTVFFPWTVHFTSHIFTDGQQSFSAQKARASGPLCFCCPVPPVPGGMAVTAPPLFLFFF